MRVLAIQNFADTPLGLVRPALEAAGARIDLRRADLDEPLPVDHHGHDALVVLGGGQSAIDDDDYPYLPHLSELTRRFGEADKSVLGICLGSQIVARGHGATNILGRPVEFGWHEVRPTDAGRADPVIASIGDAAPLFHWHLDTFTLPPGAVHLATSAMTPYQAFRIGRAVYGIQFHFEADTTLVRDWNVAFAEEIEAIDTNWAARHRIEAIEKGVHADRVGQALAAAWVATIR
ncbi:type 1 glutamine amidotransferase [Kaistia dalseonensis]|uniref:GMP synthase-like glutamine amidotransferase n=1 Tax=Kaistia dalseonensis TaxID=410840 RepID=A0ABU0H6Z9_9HYPH|nr:type 1 glutamine amidotransferase [Kaistia dalseonensis]MCX5495486.1 type 1 glutamine amidotransferase [Kaistia dalseonensis]MDQ0438077.1 GMP synthase-like glutamine amidotransferase [Kaistia dalseonensis]